MRPFSRGCEGRQTGNIISINYVWHSWTLGTKHSPYQLMIIKQLNCCILLYKNYVFWEFWEKNSEILLGCARLKPKKTLFYGPVNIFCSFWRNKKVIILWDYRNSSPKTENVDIIYRCSEVCCYFFNRTQKEFYSSSRESMALAVNDITPDATCEGIKILIIFKF